MSEVIKIEDYERRQENGTNSEVQESLREKRINRFSKYD